MVDFAEKGGIIVKKINISLILGSLLLLILLSIALFPNLFSDSNPYSMTLVHTYMDENNELVIMTPPFEPSENYVLGSDEVGRDIWSLVVYGTRLTLVLALSITILRFLLALPLGMAGGMGSRFSKSLIDQFNIVLTTIPPLLIGILFLKMNFFTSLYKIQSIFVFAITLTLIGWARIGNMVLVSSSRIMEETFILSEKAIGKRKLSIAIKNVLPHILPEIVVLFFMEIARVLTLMMQLGIFGIFVGNIRIISNSGSFGYAYYNLPYEPEWSGLLGATKEFIRSAPWVVFTSAMFFVISVLAFNLFGEGLRIELQKKNSRFISNVKSLFSKNIETTKDQRITFGISILLGIFMLVSIIFNIAKSDYTYTEVNQSGYNYENVIVGSNESLNVANIIGEFFSSIDVKSLGKDYYQIFDGIDKIYFSGSSIALDNKSLQFGKDIIFKTGFIGENHYEIMDITEEFYDVNNVDIHDKLLYVDSDVITMKAIENNIEYFVDKGAKGIVTTSEDIVSTVAENKPYYLIILEDSYKDLLQDREASIELNLVSEKYDRQGKNVIGYIEGNDPILSKKLIVVGMDYGFVNQENSYEILNFYFSMIKTLKENEDVLKKSIIFVFYPDEVEGVEYFSDHQLSPQKNVMMYLDMTGIESGRFDKIKFSDELSPITRYYGFTFANQFTNKMDSIISDERITVNSNNSYLYLNNGMTTLLFETEGNEKYSIHEFGEIFTNLIIDNAH